MKGQQSKRSILAIVFLLCVLGVFVLSNVYIVMHANHLHSHHAVDGGCEACVQLQRTEKNLRQFSVVLIGALFTIAGPHLALAATKVLSAFIAISTPITLKSRMNN